jgi:hypothetical protein
MYARWLNVGTIYTPQMVVNGTTEFVGSYRDRALKAVADGLGQKPAPPLSIRGRVEGRFVHIEWPEIKAEDSELVLALVQKSGNSDVARGENSGRKLSHVQIVRNFLRVPIHAGLKKDAIMNLPEDFEVKGWEIIGLVQRKTDGKISAAGKFDFEKPAGK